MKKMKRNVSLLLLSSMFFASFSGIAAMAENTNILVNENFEESELGTADIGGNTDAAITVAEDSFSGGKALKITADTKDHSVTIPFGTDLSEGKYRVSFDFRAENHSRHIKRFAQPYNNKNTAENFSSVATGYMWYYEIGKTTEHFKKSNDKASNIMKNRYMKIEYIFDVDNKTFDMLRDDVLIAKDQPYYRTGDAAGDINRLYFLFENKDTHNGTENDGTDENNGIYWIDNIYVERVQAEPYKITPSENLESVRVDFLAPVTDIAGKLSVFKGSEEIPSRVSLSEDNMSATLQFDEALSDFTSYTLIARAGLTSSAANILPLSEDKEFTFVTAHATGARTILNECFEGYDVGELYTWQNQSGFKDTKNLAIIERDPVSGSKALKVILDDTANTGIRVVPKTSSELPETGKYRVSYSMRIKNHSKGMFRMAQILNSANIAILGGETRANWAYYASNSVVKNYAFRMSDYKDKYINCAYIIDLDKKTYDMEVNGVIGQRNIPYFSGERASNISGIAFEFNNEGTSSFPLGPDTGAGEYYIDNLTIEPLDMAVVSATPENGSSTVTSEKEYRIGLNMMPEDISILGEYIDVYEGTKKLSENTDYTVGFDEENEEIVITFAKLSEYTGYTVKVYAGIGGKNATELKDNFTYTFNTLSAAAIGNVSLYDADGEYSKLSECIGKTVTLSASILGESELQKTVIAAVKDENGAPVIVKSVDNEQIPENSADFEITVPENANDNWRVEIFLFDSLGGQKPFCEKAELAK